MSFISYLINGLGLGSVYAIIALGYTMVYGIAKMLNFAHGDVIMIGAYVALLSMTHAGMPVLPAVLIYCFRIADRKSGLQTASKCILIISCFDHSNWCQLPASEHSTFDVWCKCTDISICSQMERTFFGRWQINDLR